MKTRLIWVIFLSGFLLGLYSQTIAQEMSKQDYLDKSRKQKTTGFIMAGGGVVLLAIGAGIYFGSASETVVSCFTSTSCSSDEGEMGGGAALSIIGGLATLGSIPVFISSGKNARKAAKLSFRNEPTYIPKIVGNIPRSFPSINFSIPLN